LAADDYMVIKGLDARVGRSGPPIAVNHLMNVVKVFNQRYSLGKTDQFRQFFGLEDLQVDTGHTLWENYAPDFASPGETSKPGYVGWTVCADRRPA
jgi:hypothetical protein